MTDFHNTAQVATDEGRAAILSEALSVFEPTTCGVYARPAIVDGEPGWVFSPEFDPADADVTTLATVNELAFFVHELVGHD